MEVGAIDEEGGPFDMLGRQGGSFRQLKAATNSMPSGRCCVRRLYMAVRAAGIQTRIGNHTFRATGITIYLLNGGMLEKAE